MRDPIADLVHRYADAVVRFDVEQWADTWTHDAVWQLGGGHEIVGRDSVVSLWTSTMAGFGAVVHNVLNGTYELSERDGRGTGRWYFQEFVQQLHDAPPLFVLGHYDDTYALVDGRWLFATRRLVMHYAGPPDLSAPMRGARG